jgi:hypothetical protein
VSQLITLDLFTRTHLLPSGDFSLYVFTANTQDPDEPIERVNDPVLKSYLRTTTQRVPMVLVNGISGLWPVKVLSPALAAVTQDLTKHLPYPLSYGQGAAPAQRQSRRRKASGAAGQAARTVFT